MLFLISGVIHTYQCMYEPHPSVPITTQGLYYCCCFFLDAKVLNFSKYKCWRITGILPWGALIFIAGFAMREVGAYHYDNLGIYVASVVLLLAAP